MAGRAGGEGSSRSKAAVWPGACPLCSAVDFVTWHKGWLGFSRDVLGR